MIQVILKLANLHFKQQGRQLFVNYNRMAAGSFFISARDKNHEKLLTIKNNEKKLYSNNLVEIIKYIKSLCL